MANDMGSSKDIKSKLSKASINPIKTIKGLGELMLKGTLKSHYQNDMPALYGTIETNKDLVLNIAKTVRHPKSSFKSALERIKQSEQFEVVNKILTNAVEDLKTGTFYRETRDGDDMFGGLDFGEFDMNGDWGGDDFGSDSEQPLDAEANIAQIQEDNASERTNAEIGAIEAAAEADINTQKAVHESDVKLSLMRHSQTLGAISNVTTMTSAVHETMNNHLTAMSEMFREAHNQTMGELTAIKDAVVAIKEYTVPKQKEYESEKKNKRDPFGGENGAFDLGAYFKNVIGNISDYTPIGFIGSMAGMMSPDMVKMMWGDTPWQIVTDALYDRIMPKSTKKAISQFDKTLSGFLPSLLNKARDYGDDYLRGGNGFLRSVAQMLGYTEQTSNWINPGDYNKDKVDFTGKVAKAITEVIPLQLSKIVSLMSGEPMQQFNYETGTFVDSRKTFSEYSRKIRDLTPELSEVTDAFDARISNPDLLITDKQRTELRDIVHDMLQNAAKDQGFINPEKVFDNDNWMGLAKYMPDNLNAFEYEDLLKAMLKSFSPAEMMNLSKSFISARKATKSRTKYVKEELDNAGLLNIFSDYIISNPDEKNALANDSTKGREDISWMSNAKYNVRVKEIIDRFSKKTPIQQIMDILNRGIITFSYDAKTLGKSYPDPAFAYAIKEQDKVIKTFDEKARIQKAAQENKIREEQEEINRQKTLTEELEEAKRAGQSEDVISVKSKGGRKLGLTPETGETIEQHRKDLVELFTDPEFVRTKKFKNKEEQERYNNQKAQLDKATRFLKSKLAIFDKVSDIVAKPLSVVETGLNAITDGMKRIVFGGPTADKITEQAGGSPVGTNSQNSEGLNQIGSDSVARDVSSLNSAINHLAESSNTSTSGTTSGTSGDVSTIGQNSITSAALSASSNNESVSDSTNNSTSNIQSGLPGTKSPLGSITSPITGEDILNGELDSTQHNSQTLNNNNNTSSSSGTSNTTNKGIIETVTDFLKGQVISIRDAAEKAFAPKEQENEAASKAAKGIITPEDAGDAAVRERKAREERLGTSENGNANEKNSNGVGYKISLTDRIKMRAQDFAIDKIKDKALLLKDEYIGIKDETTGLYEEGKYSDKVNKLVNFKNESKEKAKGLVSDIKTAVRHALYGDDVYHQTKTINEDGSVELGEVKLGKGNTGVVGMIKDAAQQFTEFIFGTDENSESRKIWKSVKEEAKKALPGAVGGAAVGYAGTIGAGILTGLWLPGGPAFGAILGSAAGFVKSSDSLKNYLFGTPVDPEDLSKGRKGAGLISKEVQDGVKKYVPNLGVGAAIGALAGNVGLLPAGLCPMAGAAIGSFGGLITASDELREVLFGKKDDDDSGYISKNTRTKMIKALPGAVIGGIGAKALLAGIGSMGLIPSLLTLPGGPLVTALGVIGGGLAAGKVEQYLFGEKDANGDPIDGKEGIFSKVFNFTREKIFDPFFIRVDEMAKSVGEWYHKDILDPLKNAMEPIKQEIKESAGNIKRAFKMFGYFMQDALDKVFEKAFGTPFSELAEKITSRAEKLVNRVITGIGKAIGKMISSPFKLLELMGNRFAKSQSKRRKRRFKQWKKYNRSGTEEEFDEYDREHNFRSIKEEIYDNKRATNAKSWDERLDDLKQQRERRKKERLARRFKDLGSGTEDDPIIDVIDKRQKSVKGAIANFGLSEKAQRKNDSVNPPNSAETRSATAAEKTEKHVVDIKDAIRDVKASINNTTSAIEEGNKRSSTESINRENDAKTDNTGRTSAETTARYKDINNAIYDKLNDQVNVTSDINKSAEDINKNLINIRDISHRMLTTILGMHQEQPINQIAHDKSSVKPVDQTSPILNNQDPTMSGSGCGPAVASMMNEKLGVDSNPVEASALASAGGYRDQSGGTSPKFLTDYAKSKGASVIPGKTDADSIKNGLTSGSPIALMGKGGSFGSGEHFIMADGMAGDNAASIIDPLGGIRKTASINELAANSDEALYGRGKRKKHIFKFGKGISFERPTNQSYVNAKENIPDPMNIADDTAAPYNLDGISDDMDLIRTYPAFFRRAAMELDKSGDTSGSILDFVKKKYYNFDKEISKIHLTGIPKDIDTITTDYELLDKYPEFYRYAWDTRQDAGIPYSNDDEKDLLKFINKCRKNPVQSENNSSSKTEETKTASNIGEALTEEANNAGQSRAERRRERKAAQQAKRAKEKVKSSTSEASHSTVTEAIENLNNKQEEQSDSINPPKKWHWTGRVGDTDVTRDSKLYQSLYKQYNDRIASARDPQREIDTIIESAPQDKIEIYREVLKDIAQLNDPNTGIYTSLRSKYAQEQKEKESNNSENILDLLGSSAGAIGGIAALLMTMAGGDGNAVGNVFKGLLTGTVIGVGAKVINTIYKAGKDIFGTAKKIGKFAGKTIKSIFTPGNPLQTITQVLIGSHQLLNSDDKDDSFGVHNLVNMFTRGTFAKSGIGQAIIKKFSKKTAEKAAKKGIETAVKTGAKNTAKQAAENAMRDASSNMLSTVLGQTAKEGTPLLLDSAGRVLVSSADDVAEAGLKTVVEQGSKEVVEDVAESAAKGGIVKTIINKVKDLMSKVLGSKKVAAVAGKFAPALAKAKNWIIKFVSDNADTWVVKAAKSIGGSFSKLAGAIGTGGLITIAFLIWDFFSGMSSTAEYFNIEKNAVTLGMKLSSGITKALVGLLSNIPGIGAILTMIIPVGPIAQEIYKFFSDDATDAKLAEKQQKFKDSVSQYGTTISEYAENKSKEINSNENLGLTEDGKVRIEDFGYERAINHPGEYVYDENDGMIYTTAEPPKRAKKGAVCKKYKGQNVWTFKKKLLGLFYDKSKLNVIEKHEATDMRDIRAEVKDYDMFQENSKGEAYNLTDSALGNALTTAGGYVDAGVRTAADATGATIDATQFVAGFGADIAKTGVDAVAGVAGTALNSIADVIGTNVKALTSIITGGVNEVSGTTEGAIKAGFSGIIDLLSYSLQTITSSLFSNDYKNYQIEKGLIPAPETGQGRGRKEKSNDNGRGGAVFDQTDPKWNKADPTMKDAGCGPTVAAMMVDRFGRGPNPVEASQMAYEEGFRDPDGGTDPRFFSAYGEANGINMREGSTDAADISSSLTEGRPVALMGQGDAFGSGMHYMLAEGINDSGSVSLIDPIGGKRMTSSVESLSKHASAAIYGQGRGRKKSSFGRGLKRFVNGRGTIIDTKSHSVGGELLESEIDPSFSKSKIQFGKGPVKRFGKGSGYPETINGMTYYSQGDDRWGGISYTSTGNSGQTIATSGCGPTSMAMAMKSLGVNVTPVETAKWSVEHGHRTANSGTDWGYFADIAEANGLAVEETSDWNKVVEALKNKLPVVASMNPGHFTSAGHYILLAGMEGNKVLVNDPNDWRGPMDKSKTKWDQNIITSEAAEFWIVSKNGKGVSGPSISSSTRAKTVINNNPNGFAEYYEQQEAIRDMLNNTEDESVGGSTTISTNPVVMTTIDPTASSSDINEIQKTASKTIEAVYTGKTNKLPESVTIPPSDPKAEDNRPSANNQELMEAVLANTSPTTNTTSQKNYSTTTSSNSNSQTNKKQGFLSKAWSSVKNFLGFGRGRKDTKIKNVVEASSTTSSISERNGSVDGAPQSYFTNYNKSSKNKTTQIGASITKYGRGSYTVMTIEQFEKWLAEASIVRHVKLIQLHHTWDPMYSNFNGSNHVELQQKMRDYHVKDCRYSDIAQHITTFPDGKIVLGRSMERDPAGIIGGNVCAVCIENLGRFDIGKDVMTDAQKTTIIRVVAALLKKFGLNASDNVTYHGWWTESGQNMGDYDSSRSCKTCPGTNFFGGNTRTAYEKNLKPLIEQAMGGTSFSLNSSTSASSTNLTSSSLQTISGYNSDQDSNESATESSGQTGIAKFISDKTSIVNKLLGYGRGREEKKENGKGDVFEKFGLDNEKIEKIKKQIESIPEKNRRALLKGSSETVDAKFKKSLIKSMTGIDENDFNASKDKQAYLKKQVMKQTVLRAADLAIPAFGIARRIPKIVKNIGTLGSRIIGSFYGKGKFNTGITETTSPYYHETLVEDVSKTAVIPKSAWGRGRFGRGGDMANGMVYYDMTDSRWASHTTGGSGTIGGVGCCITSLAMCISQIAGKAITPDKIPEEHSETLEGGGMRWWAMTQIAAKFGGEFTDVGASREKILQALSEGKPVIIYGDKLACPICDCAYGQRSGAHCVVIVSISADGKTVRVNDPGRWQRNSQDFSIDNIKNWQQAYAASKGGKGIVGTVENVSTSSSSVNKIANSSTNENNNSNSTESKNTNTSIRKGIAGFIEEKTSIVDKLLGNIGSSFSDEESQSSDTNNSSDTSSDSTNSTPGQYTPDDVKGISFPKYTNIPDDKLLEIAAVAAGEQGPEDPLALRQEISQMANLNEKYDRPTTWEGGLSKTVRPNTEGGWYSIDSFRGENYNAVKSGGEDQKRALDAAREVLLEGKRVLPRSIDEHDCESDILGFKGRNGYSLGDGVSNRYDSNYKFYTFFGQNGQKDISGATPEARKKFGDFPGDNGKGRRRFGRGLSNTKYVANSNNEEIISMDSDALKEYPRLAVINNKIADSRIKSLIETLDTIHENWKQASGTEVSNNANVDRLYNDEEDIIDNIINQVTRLNYGREIDMTDKEKLTQNSQNQLTAIKQPTSNTQIINNNKPSANVQKSNTQKTTSTTNNKNVHSNKNIHDDLLKEFESGPSMKIEKVKKSSQIISPNEDGMSPEKKKTLNEAMKELTSRLGIKNYDGTPNGFFVAAGERIKEIENSNDKQEKENLTYILKGMNKEYQDAIKDAEHRMAEQTGLSYDGSVKNFITQMNKHLAQTGGSFERITPEFNITDIPSSTSVHSQKNIHGDLLKEFEPAIQEEDKANEKLAVDATHLGKILGNFGINSAKQFATKIVSAPMQAAKLLNEKLKQQKQLDPSSGAAQELTNKANETNEKLETAAKTAEDQAAISSAEKAVAATATAAKTANVNNPLLDRMITLMEQVVPILKNIEANTAGRNSVSHVTDETKETKPAETDKAKNGKGKGQRNQVNKVPVTVVPRSPISQRLNTISGVSDPVIDVITSRS